MFGLKKRSEAGALVGLANVYSALERAVGKQWHAQWKRSEGGSRDWNAIELTARTDGVSMIPADLERLVMGCLRLASDLKDREWQYASSLASARNGEEKAKHELDEARKRIASLEAELEQARESLRDKLAGRAMQPLLDAVTRDNPHLAPVVVRRQVSQEAYAQADAMLAERAAIVDVEVKP